MDNLNEKDFTDELRLTFEKNGLSPLLNEEREKMFYLLTDRMLTENKKYNLTAITEPSKIILNHYADCAAIEAKFKKNATVIDVGCGAGFPTLPLAIVRPDLQILAIDSTAKRIAYVSETAEILGLPNVKAAVMRAEDGGKNPQLRESFDYATARAVAELRILCELCIPFVKVGGKMIAMKGRNAQDELEGARHGIGLLGGKGCRIEQMDLIGADGEVFTHPLVTVDKTSATPKNLPRPFSQISKKPL